MNIFPCVVPNTLPNAWKNPRVRKSVRILPSVRKSVRNAWKNPEVQKKVVYSLFLVCF